jgi:type VI secretion system protein ImpK
VSNGRSDPAPAGNGAASPREREPLVALAREWLAAIITLRWAEKLPDADRIRVRMIELRNEFESQTRAQGYPEQDRADATFALVAFTDETALSKSTSFLSRVLASDSGNSGVRYFEALDRLRRERHGRIDVLELYLTCLLLGFRGEYGLRPASDLALICADIAKEVAVERGNQVARAPDLRSPPRPASRRRYVPPWWYPAAAFALLALVAFGIVSWSNHGQVDAVRNDFKNAIEPVSR